MTSRRRGPKTWAAARAMYQAGWTARAVAEKFDLGVTNVYRRSAKEGWRKDDLPDEPGDWAADLDLDLGPGLDLDQVLGEAADTDVRAVARAAMTKAIKLLQVGQFGRAAEAVKVADMIGRLAERLPDPAQTAGADDPAAIEALRARILALGRRQAETGAGPGRRKAGGPRG